MTQEEYLKERKLIDNTFLILEINRADNITFDDVYKQVQKAKKFLEDRNIPLSSSLIYTDFLDDEYVCLKTTYKDHETISECEKRLEREKVYKDYNIKTMKRLIELNPKEAVETLKDMELI